MNTERLDMLMRDQKLTDDTKAPIQSVGMHRRTSSGMLTAQLPIPGCQKSPIYNQLLNYSQEQQRKSMLQHFKIPANYSGFDADRVYNQNLISFALCVRRST